MAEFDKLDLLFHMPIHLDVQKVSREVDWWWTDIHCPPIRILGHLSANQSPVF